MGETGGISIINLTKNYGDVVALNNVSLTVEGGEVVGLIGPNGAGKSTLMKIIVGILKPTSGTVSVEGFDVVGEPERARRVIGYLPENPSLYTALTVREFLRFVGKIRGVNDDVLESRISESLRNFTLADKADSLVGSLSKGMKQKVALIAAALHDPAVLILDEPQTALDPKMQAFVTGWIASQGRSGKTVLLSTHNLEVVQDYATRIAIIDRGSVIASGGLENLRRLADTRSDSRLVDVFLKLTEGS
ncbi:MAG TPA: ABC transporter ATP-binding protein [Nitrososphaerales archaeon]|nr:ABC transporter ATP-binding protein [Nitrososphaerales archaeon]